MFHGRAELLLDSSVTTAPASPAHPTSIMPESLVTPGFFTFPLQSRVSTMITFGVHFVRRPILARLTHFVWPLLLDLPADAAPRSLHRSAVSSFSL